MRRRGASRALPLARSKDRGDFLRGDLSLGHPDQRADENADHVIKKSVRADRHGEKVSLAADVQIGDRLAEGMLLAIMEMAERVMKDPMDYEARANIMWSGTIAHNDTCSLGRQEDWFSHAMEHEISAEYDATHGAGLAVIFPAFLQYASKHNPHKVAQLAHRVLGIADSGNMEQDAMQGALTLKTWLHDVLQMPVTFAQLGIPNPDLELLNTRLHRLKGEVLHGYMDLDAEATMEIYQIAMS